MASRTREEKQRALLFGSRDVAHRRPTSTGVTESVGGGDEMLEAANSGKVNGLRGRVGEMRHVS